MNGSSTHYKVKTIKCQKVLNSHLELTNEFTVELENGDIGVGASSQGETISVYEDRSTRSDNAIVTELVKDRLFDQPIDQESLDRYLDEHIRVLGRNNAWAISVAFFNAINFPLSKFWSGDGGKVNRFPRICLNILNGGNHAYTNPVLSDFHEYLIVPRFDDTRRLLEDHARVQCEVRQKLAGCQRTVVSGNPVSHFATRDNREVIGFLQDVLDRLGLTGDYGIMVDASAGDLWNGRGYEFALTDGSVRSTEELCSYWNDIIRDYDMEFLEDPFGEYDRAGWKALAMGSRGVRIIGDNLYSTDADRLDQGAREGLTHGLIVKPNQAGTVTAVRRALEVAKRSGQVAITSHRSISTESTYLSVLTVMDGAGYMKIGPLYTDYSSVVRLNELIRLTGVDLG